MPDEKHLFEQATNIASIFSKRKITISAVNPYKTSSTHHNCGGKIQRNKDWDFGSCSLCDMVVNTHHNASLNVKIGGILPLRT